MSLKEIVNNSLTDKESKHGYLDLYEKLFDLKKMLFNEKHDITIKGYEVELYVQNETESHFSSGVYSVLFDEWSNTPEKENITIVPTIIDPSIEAPLEGKKAFEYVVNHKYFNHPTNNINFWVKNPPPKPTIEEDKKALDKSALTIYTNLDDDNNKQKTEN